MTSAEMTPARFDALASRYAGLRLVVVGDFCLDRYLEIDSARGETSIETGLPVHNVVAMRSQPGAAGTVLANLVALGIGTIHAVGFCGDDGEGYELRRALAAAPGVRLDHFLTTPLRRTFTYCKPLICTPGQTPRELERLDSKNWTPTPVEVSGRLAQALTTLAGEVDGIIVMEQTDLSGTGVIAGPVITALRTIASARPTLPMLADSRRGLGDYPPLSFKMNAAELAALDGINGTPDLSVVRAATARLANHNRRPAFVTLAERGVVVATADGTVDHLPALPLRGPIDVVGAGDSVSANLLAALAAGATPREAGAVAMAASSHVIHQLATTGTANVAQIRALLSIPGCPPQADRESATGTLRITGDLR